MPPPSSSIVFSEPYRRNAQAQFVLHQNLSLGTGAINILRMSRCNGKLQAINPKCVELRLLAQDFRRHVPFANTGAQDYLCCIFVLWIWRATTRSANGASRPMEESSCCCLFEPIAPFRIATHPQFRTWPSAELFPSPETAIRRPLACNIPLCEVLFSFPSRRHSCAALFLSFSY
jgi:hypothetical protein